MWTFRLKQDLAPFQRCPNGSSLGINPMIQRSLAHGILELPLVQNEILIQCEAPLKRRTAIKLGAKVYSFLGLVMRIMVLCMTLPESIPHNAENTRQ